MTKMDSLRRWSYSSHWGGGSGVVVLLTGEQSSASGPITLAPVAVGTIDLKSEQCFFGDE
jgi:hypothetical protein